MNNGKLILASAVIAGTFLLSFPILKNNLASRYLPLKDADKAPGKEESYKGSAEWFFNMRKDENGKYNPERMRQVAELVALQNKRRATSAWPLTFTFLGPDNVGGRTRAICIDKNDHTHIFAGGVSGGLFESHDAGSTWTHNPASDQYDVLTITTIAQAANGDWYFGTGEGIYYSYYGDGTGGYIGGGVWKSTDNGATFSHLASTGLGTTNASNPSTQFASVGKIATDPTDPTRIYVSTGRGLMISSDAGNTFGLAGPGLSGQGFDVDVASDHTVYAVIGQKLYRSGGANAGNIGSFVAANAASGYPQSGMGRTECAISPQDPNYVYVVLGSPSEALLGAYMSTDGGTSYHQIAGAGNLIMDPFSEGGGGVSGQASYDMCMAVDAFNKGHIVVGGVSLWQWNMSDASTFAGQWGRADDINGGFGSPNYVHSDNHIIVYDQTVPNKLFVGCDGGIFRSLDNTLSFIPCNKNYDVTQFYDVASDYFAPTRNVFLGGCQDNGTQFVDGLGNTTMSATSVGGGDGGTVAFSFLNPNAIFGTVYYGTCARSANRGNGGGAEFYNARITSKAGLGNSGFASFVTPIALWESANDQLSADSVLFTATAQGNNFATGNGIKTAFADTLIPDFNGTPQPNASVIPGSVVITVGSMTFTDNGAGVFTGTGLAASPASTINYATKIIALHLATAPSSSTVLKIAYQVTYNSGVVLNTVSHTNNIHFTAVCPSTLSSLGPNDSVYVKDIVQARLAVGFTAANGLFVCLRPLDFSTIPTWVKIGGANSIPDAFTTGSQGVMTMKWSDNGNTLFVSNDNNAIFRIDNLGSIGDTIHSDVDVKGAGGDVPNPKTPVRCTCLGVIPTAAGSNIITQIDVDPSNPNNLLVAVSGYSAGAHVYICTNALAAPSNKTSMANFTAIQGGLIPMPVYACSFDKYKSGNALIGTEFGIYSTDNVLAAGGAVTWSSQNSTFAHVPTLKIHQSRLDPWNSCQNSGVFYIATHGRGVWKSEVSFSAPTGITNFTSNKNPASPVIRVFPNPMTTTGQVFFNLNEAGTVKIRIYSLAGQEMKEMNIQHLMDGPNTIDFDSSDLSAGTYLMSFESGTQRGVSKFIVIK